MRTNLESLTDKETLVIAPSFMRISVLPLLLMTVFCLTSLGCETQSPYAACELDEEVTKKGICTGEGTAATGTTSCVVRQHPHCVASICLSHFGSTPFCSETCATDLDCPESGFCWNFSDDQRYCVMAERKGLTGN
ncbi:MAG: hypothetical protein CMH53_05915 [Myxococcales bacterium]|nr:hypothetical protein [Myxococcales bacterium]